MQLDHVELFVPSREQAAAWYGKALGFEVLEEHRDWAIPGGPLMISNDGGNTMLALFRGRPQGEDEIQGFRRVAFRVSAAEFVRFLSASAEWRDKPLGAAEVSDHGKAFSVYFSDPWGNRLEVTTYDYAEAAKALA